MNLQSRASAYSARTPGTAAEDWSLATLDMQSLGGIMMRQWYAVLLSVLVFATLSIAAFLLIKPRYDARSDILVEPPRHRALTQDDKTSDNPVLDTSVVESQIPLILSNRLLAQVVKQENLAADREFAAKAGSDQPEAAQDTGDANRIDPRLAPVITHLLDHLDVSRVGKSNVVEIRVRSEDPQKAATLADLIANTYVADQVSSRVKATQQAASLFADRLDALRAQVRQSESALAAFRRRNGMTTTSDEKVIISDQLLGDMNERLAFASSDAASKRSKYDQAARFAGGGGNLSTLPEVIQSPAVLQLQNKLADALRSQADSKAVLGNAHPDVIRQEAQVQLLHAALARQVGRLTTMLKNDYLVAKSSEDALQKQVTRLVSPAGVSPDAGVQMRELERTNLANKALFENFLEKAKLTQEETSFEMPESRLVSPALAPIRPVFPKLIIFLPAGIAAGVVVGLLAALLLDSRRSMARRRYAYAHASARPTHEEAGE